MKSKVVCICLAGLLGCETIGKANTFQEVRDKNGVRTFTNTLPPGHASTEVQRAREQAEIEYWRALEARARSLRNTPDTEVHRKKGTSWSEEDFRVRSESARGKKSRRGRDKMAELSAADQAGPPDPDKTEKVRRGQKEGSVLQIKSKSGPREKPKRSSRKSRLALK
ncbi:MAG: hypothetical protein HY892_14455 [Deltaproteobacteria bacterium]|nr:hypothetical protein [Deltaproteobacteria bacterium]